MRYIPVVMIWVLCAWFALVLLDKKPSAESPMVGRVLPTLTLPLLQGDAPVALAEHTRNRITMIHFFASWCLPCQQEHEALLALHKKNIIPMMGIAWKNKPSEAAAWLARLGNPYDVTLYDLQGKSTVPFGLTGVPETFIVGADGTILYHSKSILTEETITRDIVPLLKEEK